MATVVAGSVATVFSASAGTLVLTPGAAPGRISFNGRDRNGFAVTPREVYQETSIALEAGSTVTIEALLTDASYTLSGSDGGHIIEDEGVALTQRSTINFTGNGVSVADSGGKTVVTINQASGSVAADTIWNAAGDLVYGTGSDTAARLGIGTAGQMLVVNAGATAPEWVSAGDATAANQVTQIARATGPTTATLNATAATVTSFVAMASNSSRKGGVFINDDTNVCYLLLASGTASTTNFSVTVDPNGGLFELPVCQGGVYTGEINAVWATAGSGSLRTTELA